MSHWKSVIWDQTRHWTYRVQIVCQTNGWLRICLYMHLFFFLIGVTHLWHITGLKRPLQAWWHPPSWLTKQSLLPYQSLTAQIGLRGKRKQKLFCCLQALTELLMLRTSQLGWRLLSGWRQNVCVPFFLITVPWSLASNPVMKLGKSSFPSTKRTVSPCVWLCQQFYLLMHGPAVNIAVFIDAVFLIVWQLGTIGHKPDDLKIRDKLLIGLHQSWVPVHTTLILHEKPEIKLITSALKQFEVNESLVAVPGPQVKAEQSELSLGESALYIKSWEGKLKGCKGHGRNSEECDWGNTKEGFVLTLLGILRGSSKKRSQKRKDCGHWCTGFYCSLHLKYYY